MIENEFGAVGVDDELIKKSKFASMDQVVEMMNGCICCTVRGDLIKLLKRLLIEEKRVFDGIIIETTGLADPAPVAQTFFVDEDIQEATELDAIITVVDAKHIASQLDAERPKDAENEAAEQIVFADRVLINKTDLVTEEELAVVEKRVRALNPSAEMIRCKNSIVDPARLLHIGGFKLERVLEMEPTFLSETEHQHDLTISSICCVQEKPINIGKLQKWVSEILDMRHGHLLRYKGIVHVAGKDERFVFQGVQMLFSGGFTTPWGADEKRMSRFVFIGRNLKTEELEKGFQDCIATMELRFKVGTPVRANVDQGWTNGTVLGQWDEGNPYRIKLEDGTEVWAPEDTDGFVRAVEKRNSPKGADKPKADKTKAKK